MLSLNLGDVSGHNLRSLGNKLSTALFFSQVSFALALGKDPEFVEEVAHDGTQNGADNGARDEGRRGAGQLQNIETKEHAT